MLGSCSQFIVVGLLVSASSALPAMMLPVEETSHPTITELNSSGYLGRWYQIAVNQAFFEGSCVTADYQSVKGYNNVIALTNSIKVPFGYAATHGFAVQSPNASEPGYFDVKQGFGPTAPKTPHSYSTPNYIIMELGPFVEGLYDYSLITDDRGDGLVFVLARDPQRFADTYSSDVQEKLVKWGFTGLVPTPQTGCKYPAPPVEDVSHPAIKSPVEETSHPTIMELNSSGYLGRWYQAAALHSCGGAEASNKQPLQALA
jgi:lipocalin